MCERSAMKKHNKPHEPLKPCPYCGSPARHYSYSMGLGTYWRVECTNTDRCVAADHDCTEKLSWAVHYWNQRAPIAQQAQGGEKTKPCPRCIDIVNYPCKSDNIWGDGEEQIFFCPLCGRKLSWGTASPVR